MARFTAEQAHAIVEIQQLLSAWGHELDVRNGRQIADLLTEDCAYAVGGGVRTSRGDVASYYADRFERLSATPDGLPTHRHALVNLRVRFGSPTTASVEFNLIYFSTLGMTSGADQADPAAYADVRMDCRREPDGHWRIASFDSNQVFRRILR